MVNLIWIIFLNVSTRGTFPYNIHIILKSDIPSIKMPNFSISVNKNSFEWDFKAKLSIYLLSIGSLVFNL